MGEIKMSIEFITGFLVGFAFCIPFYIRKIKRFVELTIWFNRKSQHYILGNWLEYTYNYSKRAAYQKEYPIAYCKFMYYSRYEWLMEK